MTCTRVDDGTVIASDKGRVLTDDDEPRDEVQCDAYGAEFAPSDANGAPSTVRPDTIGVPSVASGATDRRQHSHRGASPPFSDRRVPAGAETNDSEWPIHSCGRANNTHTPARQGEVP